MRAARLPGLGTAGDVGARCLSGRDGLLSAAAQAVAIYAEQIRYRAARSPS